MPDSCDYRLYDTNVYVAWTYEEKDKFGRSVEILSDVRDGKAILVLPMLQILECIDALRKTIPMKSKQNEMTVDDVKREIYRASKIFADFFTQQEKEKHLIVLHEESHTDEYFLKVYEKLQKYTIIVVPSGKRYKYRGIGFVDLAYMYYAKAAGVKAVHTWDKGFLQAKEDPEFDSIDVIVLDEADYA